MQTAILTDPDASREAGAMAALGAGNPLLADWTSPFGLPPFDRIDAGHFEPAFEAAFREHDDQIAAIARNPAAPDFDNTVLALEEAGALLARIDPVFQALCASLTSEPLQAVERAISPRLAVHRSAVYLDGPLFTRLDRLHRQMAELGLDAEQQRVLERLHREFVQAGARLDEPQKRRCSQIIERLAGLATTFSQNVLADEAAFQLVLRDEAELAGLPEFARATARQAARDRGIEDAWVITLARSSVEPFLTFSDRRELRERVHQAWVHRGETPGRDNRPIIVEMLTLRRELAQLHGCEDFATYALTDRMAGHPDAVAQLLARVWQPACEAAEREREDLQALAREAGHELTIEAWDWRYYADRLRRERYAIDEASVKPYLQLERMTLAMFDCATRLFGVRFVERPDLPVYHPSVRAWEVLDREGAHLALFIADNFARAGKQGGAWMSELRSQSGLGAGIRPIVLNNNNFSAGAPGEPVLLSIDDARTLFHEFGHGLHGMLSAVRYPLLAGTRVAQDFVELPSQLFEHWLLEPQVLREHARHVETGEPMPEALIDKLRRARRFGQGFATVSYASCVLLDMSLHRHPDPGSLDPDAFERAELARLAMPRAMVMRHRPPHFGHLFAGESYAAGYYVYLWAEVLDADGFEAFAQAGDVFDPACAQRLLRYIYSAGNLRDPALAYRLFRGRDPSVQPMLEQRGFSTAPQAQALS